MLLVSLGAQLSYRKAADLLRVLFDRRVELPIPPLGVG